MIYTTAEGYSAHEAHFDDSKPLFEISCSSHEFVQDSTVGKRRHLLLNEGDRQKSCDASTNQTLSNLSGWEYDALGEGVIEQERLLRQRDRGS